MTNKMFIAPQALEVYKRLPKCNLHTHLEGSVRPETFIDLARQQNVQLPFDAAEAHKHFQVTGDETSLVDYLDKIMVNYLVLKDSEALRRTAFEAAEDAHKDGVIYFELRAGPVTHSSPALPVEAVIESILAGLKEAETQYGIICRFIAAGLRHHDPQHNEELARIARKYIDHGVVGFDLAGDEAGFPASLHIGSFKAASDSGLGITVHAGEASGWGNVRYAVEEIGARRIGHGVRSIESPYAMDMLLENNVMLEICPTSNVHTGTIPSIADHPVRKFFESGVLFCINDDDPVTSRTRVSNELTILDQVFDFSLDQVVLLQMSGIENSFLQDEDIKNQLKSKIQNFAALKNQRLPGNTQRL